MDIPTKKYQGKVYYLVHFPAMSDNNFRGDSFARARWWHQNVKPFMDTCKGGYKWWPTDKMLGFGDPRDAVRFKLTWHDHQIAI